MAKGDIKILDKLYINQNLICLIVSFIFLKLSRCWSSWDGKLLYLVMALFFVASISSVLLTTIFYTKEYCRKKAYKAKCHKMRYNYIKEVRDTGNLENAHGEKIVNW